MAKAELFKRTVSRGAGNVNALSAYERLPHDVASPAGRTTRSLVTMMPLPTTTGEPIGLGLSVPPPPIGPIAVAPTPFPDNAPYLSDSQTPTGY